MTQEDKIEFHERMLGVLLGFSNIPKGLTQKERENLTCFGDLPSGLVYIQIVKPEWGGEIGINNVAIMTRDKAKEYNSAMNHIHKARDFTEEDKPYLKRFVKRFGGITYDDV